MVHAYSHFQALAGGIDDGLPDLSRVSPLVIEEAVRVFGDRGKAERWLLSPLQVFEGWTPAQRAASSGDGEKFVLEVLARIEHGMFS